MLCWILPFLAGAQELETVKFSTAKNWDELKEEAQKSNKPIFIDAFATWCGPCKLMDQEVFTDKRVADFLNENFVSIRVQMDSTKGDGLQVKLWRNDANKLKAYVTAFPSFLFFTPEGNYSGLEQGFHNSEEFLALLKRSIDPQSSYAAQIRLFREGKLSKGQVLMLANLARANKDAVVDTIARFYKKKYIDGQPLDSLLNPEANKFISEFFMEAFTVEDEIIQYLYKNPKRADSLFERKNYSQAVTDLLIERDYITSKLPKENTATPDWKTLEKVIAHRYDKGLAQRLILGQRIRWAFEKNKDFQEFTKLEFQRIELYGADTTGFGRLGLNNMLYEIVFKKVNDTGLLKKAAELMKNMTETESPKSSGHLDTYACLLYKSGQRKKAIQVEQRALELAKSKKDEKNIKYYMQMIELMLKGEEIWKMDLD